MTDFTGKTLNIGDTVVAVTTMSDEPCLFWGEILKITTIAVKLKIINAPSHWRFGDTINIPHDKVVKVVTGKPVKMVYEQTYLCPPDCGGAEFDEYDYVAHCPSCNTELPELPRPNYCAKCGQKLGWNARTIINNQHKANGE